MLKQIIVTLDTSDPLQAQLLVEYLASNDRVRFGRCCMLLGYLAGTQHAPENKPVASPESTVTPPSPKIGLTLEDLGIGELPSSQGESSDSAHSIISASPNSVMDTNGATHSVSPIPPVKEEMKTASKPKIGGGLFGLD